MRSPGQSACLCPRSLPEFLRDGEGIQYLLPGISLYVDGVRTRASFFVVVTDRSVTVLYGGRFRRTFPKAVHDRLPRRTEIGPVEAHPSPGPVLTVAGLRLEIDEEYVGAVHAANLEGARDLPPDPLPEL
ncbi:hypothetical protein [Amycolatopsis australiensis]|uniref:PH domain-containing protein n=1 Tax=Amycolatopsis australiensis TaxID=546364 RepID=A0A1K1R7U7_9PSEU|nr:hypothetical protein [Amycolatopsis australiensis]SFW68306.1 hypothetical protein SAMN04489730_2847 [Amycolatopsis australiensis]